MQIGPVSDSTIAPFRLRSSPHDAFAHPAWARAERQTLALIGRGQRVLLLGQPGTGKTLLLHRLEQTLRAQGVSVRHLCAGDPPDELPADAVLLIDEAGLFTEAELDDLMRRPNTLVAAGLPSVAERLADAPIAVRPVTLEPLSPEDVARFVLARLAASGRPRGSFTPEALVALAVQSGGLLRLVIILAGGALFVAEQRGAAEVTADDVAEAASMRSVVPLETEPEVSPEPVALSPQIEIPESSPAWLAPVATTRPWARSLAIAGVAGWVCASVGVIAIAAVAARAVGSIPVAVQDVQGRSTPQLASAAAPGLAVAPKAESTPVPLPVQTAAASAPAQAVAAVPPAPGPTPPPETERSDIEVPPLPPAVLATSPAMAEPAEPSSVFAFSGPILNETMGQGGQLSLQLRTRGAHGPVAAVFHASKGLIGSGVLRGEIGTDGRVTLSGRLMMGRNPFDCALQATIKGERLVGAATFVRATSGVSAHSSFTLTRL